jgi:hypothetical protein
MTQSSGTTNNIHFTWRLSSLFIFLLATSTFALGALFVNFPQRTEEAPGSSSITTPDSHPIEKVEGERNMNGRLDLLFKVLFSPALLITAVAAINQRVTQEMEQEMEPKIKEIKGQVDKRIEAESERNYKEFIQKYKKDIKALQKDITPYIHDPDKQQRIRERFSRMLEAFVVYDQEMDACREAGEWMDSKNNRQELLDFLLAQVDSIQVLDNHSTEFKQNLEGCLDWLHASFNQSSPLTFSIHDCASALLKNFVCIETYNMALDRMANFEAFENIFGSSTHLKKYLQVWIDWLKDEIKNGMYRSQAHAMRGTDNEVLEESEELVPQQAAVPVA